ncbi:thiosulfate sulfurtransferase GlpE [Alteromonas oceanisediminis]|uniref:thiosulfate sulfurtransferase GlpE n=1 Tax=Alteromonas oceanisediminis TaxID=2836180 RepID=UPI001BD9D92D|nr:thiosulfate sulfurtransferase GlpE [Alteromonas oceanisediminis]MBT0586762.1 thiosulfate sulfurtransferase GlpE [Alteromonas oceanisediminis]
MTEFAHIDVNKTEQMMQNSQAAIVDIRDEQSFAAGHMPGAYHLTNGSLHDFTQRTDFDKPVIVVCYHGISSQQAAQFLIHQGYEEVYSMDGGFEAWKQSFPFETGAAD